MIAYYEKNISDIRVNRSINLSFPPHLHKEIELVLSIGGDIEVTCDNQTRTLKKGDFLLVLPYTVHSYHTKDHSEIILGIIPTDYFPVFKTCFSQKAVCPFINQEYTAELCKYTNMLNEEYHSSNNIGKVLGYLYLIFACVIENISFVPRETRDNHEIIQKTLKYLEENFREELTLKKVSQSVGLNPSYFSRFFSDKIGCTLIRYLHELRINHAKHLLSSSDLSVTQIAYESGFSTLRSFNRTFYDLVGTTPLKYKKQSGKIT